jgi:hypothetical protein
MYYVFLKGYGLATETSINDIYAVEMRAHYFSDADEKGRDRFNVGHVLEFGRSDSIHTTTWRRTPGSRCEGEQS